MNDDQVTDMGTQDDENDSMRNDRPYEDDLDTDEHTIDPVMIEENDDPVKDLQVPAGELKDELDQYVDTETATAMDDGGGNGAEHGTMDDRRELIEDLDDSDGSGLS